MAKPIEIVIPGGPCSGKSTSLSFLAEELSKRNYRIFIVPETATKLINPGIPDLAKIKENNPLLYMHIEKQILLDQWEQKQRFLSLAMPFDDKQTVIIHDRGLMDVSAYMNKEDFQNLMKELNLSYCNVCESYDAVFHLVTAARGAEQYYTCNNNPARQEKDLETAREMDEKTLWAWAGHPKLKIIDNRTDFKQKKERLLNGLLDVLSCSSLEIERKFLLKDIPDFKNPILQQSESATIQQYYVKVNGQKIRFRKRTRNGYSAYYRTEKNRLSNMTRNEKEISISAEEYEHWREFKMIGTKIIQKQRFYFFYNYQYFEMDLFYQPEKLYLLEIELENENDPVDLPPFLDINREVTDNPAYTNSKIASRL